MSFCSRLLTNGLSVCASIAIACSSAAADASGESFNDFKRRVQGFISAQQLASARLARPMSEKGLDSQLGTARAYFIENQDALDERWYRMSFKSVEQALSLRQLLLVRFLYKNPGIRAELTAGRFIELVHQMRCYVPGSQSAPSTILPLLDQSLLRYPGMSGLSVARALRAARTARISPSFAMQLRRGSFVSLSEDIKGELSLRIADLNRRAREFPQGSIQRARLLERSQILRSLRRSVDQGITTMFERTAELCGDTR